MKSVVVHAVLALAGLVFAYQTWTREEEEERPQGEVTVLECKPEALTKLSLETPTATVAIEPRKDGDAWTYWVTTQRKHDEPKEEKKEEKKPEATDGKAPAADTNEAKGAAGAAAPKPEKKDEAGPGAEAAKDAAPKPPVDESLYAPKRFLANPKFKEYLATVTPMRAARGLGEVPQSKFAEFRFDKVGTFFRMECGGKKVQLDVGGRTFGAGMQYLRDPATKQVYLADTNVIRDLEAAQFKFMQVEVHDFALADIDEAVVRAQGAERRLLHRNRQVASEARWVDKAEPDRRNETFGNWFGRLARLRVTSYLPPNAEPGSDLKQSGQVTPAVTIDYFADGEPKGRLELVRVDAEGKGIYYARTEATHVWARVYDSIGKQVEDDAALVVGVEQPQDASAAPPAGAPGAPPAPGAASAPAAPTAPHGAPGAAPAAGAKPGAGAPAPTTKPRTVPNPAKAAAPKTVAPAKTATPATHAPAAK